MSKIVCIGECLIDRISNQPGVPAAQVNDWSDFVGGAPANVAAGLAQLGQKAQLISCIGTDDLGSKIKQKLIEREVDLSTLQEKQSHPTRAVYVELSDEGDRRFVGFGEFDSSAFADTQITWSEQMASELEPGDIMLSGSLELAFPVSSQAVEQAVDAAHKRGVKVFIDPNLRPVFWANGEQDLAKIKSLCQKANFLKLSKEEAQDLCGSEELDQVVKTFPKAEGVFVTDGAAGAQYQFGSYRGFMPAFEINAQDTTGAGDGFIAGLLYKLTEKSQFSSNEEVSQMVRFASAVGALVALGKGPIDPQPTLAEVKEFLTRAC